MDLTVPQEPTSLRAMRNWFWALVVLAIWALAIWGRGGPAPLPADAPAQVFSAARAEIALAQLLGPERPHPAGSAENEAVHARLLAALAALGVKSTTLNTMSCYGEQRWGAIICGQIGDVIAEVRPGQGKAIVLMAHLDSVPAGPGAADDGAGVAALLESIRALKADPRVGGHPVLALFTDGEEDGLLGAAAFVRDARWREQVGVAVNVEARGNRGPSLLFQTSPGNGALVDLYARNVKYPATSSLYGEIYKFLPNDTDMTPFLKAGLTGYNFAFVGNVAQYHTPLDRIEGLDPASLQSQGDAVLGLTRGLKSADFAHLKSGDAIDLDIMGWWLPRLDAGWALPLSLLIFAVIALAAWVRREGVPLSVGAALMPPLLLLSAGVAGFILQAIVAWISGHADPAYAHPLLLRLALAFAVWGIALTSSRRATAYICWLWLAGLGVAAAWLLPGLSPYFLFPAAVAAVTLPFGLRALPALAALMVWIGLTANAEPLMGLAITPIFTLPAAMGLIALLPLLKARRGQAVLCGALALMAAIAAGFVPAYDAAHPQRLNLLYVEDGRQAYWLASTGDRLPPALRAAAHFSASPENRIERGFAAPAGTPQFTAPSAQVARNGADITLTFNGSSAADSMALVVPQKAGLQSITLGGITTPAPAGQVVLFCSTPACARAEVTLHLAEPTSLLLMERRFGLPVKGAALAKARGELAMPSQSGDMIILASRIAVPDK